MLAACSTLFSPSSSSFLSHFETISYPRSFIHFATYVFDDRSFDSCTSATKLFITTYDCVHTTRRMFTESQRSDGNDRDSISALLLFYSKLDGLGCRSALVRAASPPLSSPPIERLWQSVGRSRGKQPDDNSALTLPPTTDTCNSYRVRDTAAGVVYSGTKDRL